jgi:putative restriction endonuclease
LIWIDREKIKELFQQINVWRRGDQRAPHKPLLILYALSKIAAGNKKRIPYSEVDKVLRPLLAQFGPPRKSYHPEQPFWWLQSDGLWELDIDPEIFPRRKSGKNPTKGKDFIVNHVDGKNFHIEKK